MNKPKPIQISSLAARFHERDGWTMELLQPYLVRGELIWRGFGPNESEHRYLIMTAGSFIDFDRLMADGHVGKVHRMDYEPGLTDLEVLHSRNW